MASVGSVSIDLSLNTTQFDKQLRSLESLELKPLNIGIELDTSTIQRQIRELGRGDYGCIPVDICPQINVAALKAQITRATADLQQNLQLNVSAAISSAIKVQATPEGSQGDAARRGAEAASQEIEAGFQRAAEKINKAIESSLTNAGKLALSPIRGVFTGFFEGIGQTFSRNLAGGAIASFQKQVGINLKDTGSSIGRYVARTTNEALGRKGSGGDGNFGSGTGGAAVPTRPRTPTGQPPSSNELEKELQELAKIVGTTSKLIQSLNGGTDKFGTSITKAAQQSLELASSFAVLQRAIANRKESDKGGTLKTPTTTQTQPQLPRTPTVVPVAQEASTTQRRGLLKGDHASLQPEDARKQVEAVRVRLEKQLRSLQQLPESATTQAKISKLLLAITTLEQRIATDIANPDIPKAVRQSLGQLKATNSKLEATKRAVEAEAQKVSASRKLPGIAKAGIGATIGAGALGAGGAFAAPSAGVGGLGFLGALPFDPTLGLAAGGIAASLGAARLAPGLLRKAGAGRLANVLETDVGKLAADALQSTFAAVRQGLGSFSKRTAAKATDVVRRGLGDSRDSLGASSQQSQRTTKGFGTTRNNRPDPDIVSKSSVAPPVPEKYWDRFFRGIETRFYRSPIFSGVAPRDRRSLTSEATGFLASGAMLTAPGATVGFLGAPLLAALTPLITTIGLVANAIGPLVGTIAQTLQRVEPLQKRLEYTSGGEVGARGDSQFVRGLAEEFKIPELTSLEAFSKFAAAAKGTKLEGDRLKEIFEGIALAGKSLQLDTQDLNLVMFAFTQILSKGKLSAEEVRLQIAERLPGAVNLFAKSLNLTVPEFTALLESGQLMAEDVLPKLGKALKDEFGESAKDASTTFLSALTGIDNAIQKLKTGFATALAPVLTGVANALGGVLNLFGENAGKVFTIAAVTLTGVAAQFFVGLTQILAGSGILQKMQAFLVPLFSRLFVTLTPFAVGILADFLDDILGAQASVIENLSQGSYNIVFSVISGVKDLSNAIGSLFSSLPKNDAFSGFNNALLSIFNGLKNVTKIIPSTVVEFGALTLILAQTLVLAQQGLNLVLAQLGVTLGGLTTSFIAAAKSGALFRSVMTTVTAGLSPLNLGIVAATAALVLFFAKADFSNEMGTKFDELGDRMAANLDKIRERLKDTSKDLQDFPKAIPDFKSKGFDLTFGLGEQFTGKPFRTDDFIKIRRQLTVELGKFYKEIGLISDKTLQEVSTGKFANYNFTIGQKQFEENTNKLKKQAQDAARVIKESGLFTGGFESNAAGKALVEINQIDSSIKELQKERVTLLSGDNVDSESVKMRVGEIDSSIQKLLDKRDLAKKPIEAVRDSVLGTIDTLKESLSSIEASAIPEAAKEQQRAVIQPALESAEQAKKKLEELKAIDLSPLGNQFAEVTKEIEKTDRQLEKALSRGQKKTVQAQTKVQEDLATGRLTPEQAQQEGAELELESLKGRELDLAKFVDTRKGQLRDLLAVPKPSTEQLEAIGKNQKEIETKELELEQTRLQISQKVVEGKRQNEEQILKDFQQVNARAQLIIQRTEAQRLARIKGRQLRGEITPEQADVEAGRERSTTAKADLTEANRQLAEFGQIRGSLQLNAEEAVQRELELTKAVSDATLRAIEAEIAARDAAKQKRIADIEEIRTKEMASIDSTRNTAINSVKQRQLEGKLEPDQVASSTTDTEISSAQSSLSVAKLRLTDVKQLRAEGVYNAREAAQKEREVIASIAQYEGQILDLRLQKQQQARERSLKILEDANRRAIALIEQQQTQADIGVLRQQLGKPLNEDTDSRAGRSTLLNQIRATDQLTAQARRELGQVRREDYESDREYTDKKIELETNYGNLVKQQLTERRDLERSLQDDAIRSIERRVESEKNRGELAIQNIEDEKSAQDLFNASVDRSRQLLESRSALSKAISDVAVAQGESEIAQLDQALEIRRKLNDEDLSRQQRSTLTGVLSRVDFSPGASELEILRRRQALEDRVAAQKLNALRQEQQLARDLLQLDLQRQRIAAQNLVFEQDIALLRAQQGKIEAEGALKEAQKTGDKQAEESAKIRLEISEKILENSAKQLENAKANLAIQSELANNSVAALNAQQQAANVQSRSTENLRNNSQDLTIVDASSSSGSSSSGSKSGSRPYHNRLVDQSGSIGLDPSTSVEAFFKRSQGLDPFESDEAYENRRLGLNPGESVEAYFNRASGFTSKPEADSALLQKPSGTTTQLQNANKPVDVQPKNNGFSQFVGALREANKDIVTRLDTLNEAMVQAFSAPRSLYVSSPTPVQDASTIYSNVVRGMVIASGNG